MSIVGKLFKPITSLLGLSEPDLPEPQPLPQRSLEDASNLRNRTNVETDPNQGAGLRKARERAARLARRGGRSFRIDLEDDGATRTGLSIGGR